ncbi:MAG: hypothetical protein JST54_12735 [Deltaproteobacteria bacterium]|nr:hypothetical protein [Deltaproteobacteria bacterium]
MGVVDRKSSVFGFKAAKTSLASKAAAISVQARHGDEAEVAQCGTDWVRRIPLPLF